MTNLLNYSEFKTLRTIFTATQPSYLQGEKDFESSTQLAYKFYLNGKVPNYAK